MPGGSAKARTDAALIDQCAESARRFDDWSERAEKRVWMEEHARASAAFGAFWTLSQGLTAPVERVLRSDATTLAFYRAMTVMHTAREVLAKRAAIKKDVVTCMEAGSRGRAAAIDAAIPALARWVERLRDLDLAGDAQSPEQIATLRAVVVDRVARVRSDAAMRALHEPRQRAVALEALRALGYDEVANEDLLTPGTYCSGISVLLPSPGKRAKRVQVDLMIAPQDGSPHIFVELKSAGDETNPNKRRKEDVERAHSVRQTRGQGTRYVVLLGGHFNVTYIGHIRASNLEWVWEHDALAGFRAILGNED